MKDGLELKDTLGFFVDTLHFRVDRIFPADSPRMYSISGHGLALRLQLATSEAQAAAAAHVELRVACSDPESFCTDDGAHDDVLVAPNGTRVLLVRDNAGEECVVPPCTPAGLSVSLCGGEFGEGRAGMLYRDLVPDRRGTPCMCVCACVCVCVRGCWRGGGLRLRVPIGGGRGGGVLG